MSFLVGDFQNGFIPGRNISDNILVSHELFHQISKKTTGKQGLLAFKIDMSKAYDRLSWNFLKATLVSMNFPPSLITLIMNCVSSVTYSTFLNGVIRMPFKPKAGIRQGDPISPYLFALCTETFSQMIQDAQQRRLLKGIKMCRQAPMISHLLFADDSIFFHEAQQQNCKNLMHIIDYYCEASGQRLNPSKSAVTLSPNFTLRNTQKCIKLLRVSAKKDLGVYLGLPTDFGSSKKLIFATLIEKVRKRILSWNNINLTPAGRLTLICSVLSSLSIYSLSAFQMLVAPLILSLALPPEDSQDNLYWTKTNDGLYSIKSGYALAFQSLWATSASQTDLHRLSPVTTVFCKSKLWSLPIQGKWKVFLWKLMTNSLPLGEEARRRSLDWDYMCRLCNNDLSSTCQSMETNAHLFRDCPFSSRIWFASPLGIRCSEGSNLSIQWIINWLLLLSRHAAALSSISMFVSTLWRIWCLRNGQRFAHTEIDLCSSLRLISEESSLNASVMSDHIRFGNLSCNYSSEVDLDTTRIRNFHPYFLIGTHLCSNSIRLKCDASWNPNLRATSGWFFKDNNGTMIHTGSSRFWASSPVQAEAMAFKLAISKAISCGYRHIDASSDCLSLILQVSGHATMDQTAKATLLSLHSMFLQLHCLSISHCPRNLNRVAHSIAKLAMV
ncbi:uncharacterized protein LOC141655725 [Silene latifolia]|uniref:uncharacterized protein LOC141655725 n=1 Tax=Silene latifolia TaxID=37657 RepID=UPI003D782761